MSRPGRWVSARSRPPRWASARGRPGRWAYDRSRSPLRVPSRSRSPQREFSNFGKAQRAYIRSWVATRGKYPRTSSSRNTPLNGAGSRGRPSSRSPSPQGAVSRSPSPEGQPSKDGDPTSPSVTVQQSRGNEDGVSATAPVPEADPKALNSEDPPDRWYGVEVSNFANGLKNVDIISFLKERFMRYGNVFSVTVYGSSLSRYALVAYTSKHEQEKALAADRDGPLGIKFSVKLWSGPTTTIFAIKVTNVEGGDLDLCCRIESEFGVFGEVTKVHVRDFTRERSALVFFKDRKGPEKALAAPSPIKTSFGEVTVSAWNKPPPTFAETYSVQSHRGASSGRSLSHRGASSRRTPYRSGAASRKSPSPQGASSDRSASPQGASSSRSPSPQGSSSKSQSCGKISKKDDNQISPSMTSNQSIEKENKASTTSNGVDVDLRELSSNEPPDNLYGVKVTNFVIYFKSINIKSYLTKHFMPYGNVVCVTMHGSDKDRYGLVFYEKKCEREKALTAVKNSPLETKHCITPWSGPSPCFFGIVVTDINDKGLNLRIKVRSEFSIFGDITLVLMRGVNFQRFALVFYKDPKGQQKALSARNPFTTSFGKVTVHAWNEPPPPDTKTSNENILKTIGYSPQQKGSLHRPASRLNGPPEAITHRAWHGRSLPIEPRRISWHQPTSRWKRPSEDIPLPEWHGRSLPTQPSRISWHQPSSEWNGPSHSLSGMGDHYPSNPGVYRPGIEPKYETSKSLFLSQNPLSPYFRENRSRSPMPTSAQIRMRHSRSKSPFFYMP